MTNKDNGYAALISEGRLVRPYPVVIMAVEGKKYGYSPRLLPEMPPDKPENIVNGELYEVDSNMLAVLDELETHPIRYKRLPTQCILTGTPSDKFPGLAKGSTVDCEVYFYNQVKPEHYLLPFISNFKSADVAD
ncbi:PREDICTED: gamma-glutamylaminecyclotransferase-like [Amphimedon queenslandica]|uniref:Gamma-glutamylcyclotransferase family protein n=1 Tax=Amphimedon queenslandica TaxID=400682 RepID=A0A1X7SWJ5_AMPQE|nr:PREDICTED: gamma-glutamylaminecyclotransferase-like [Amphimedon queenslandica]|eukprot:XP_011408686.1 PREDICTED: gamma-glutamylaminecyclotransferase-like [Amphimedon queenslandica]